MGWCTLSGCGGERSRGPAGKEENTRVINQAVPIIKVPCRARGQVYLILSEKRMKTNKRSKASYIPRKHQNRLFDIDFFSLVGFVSFPWADGPPVSDPDA